MDSRIAIGFTEWRVKHFGLLNYHRNAYEPLDRSPASIIWTSCCPVDNLWLYTNQRCHFKQKLRDAEEVYTVNRFCSYRSLWSCLDIPDEQHTLFSAWDSDKKCGPKPEQNVYLYDLLGSQGLSWKHDRCFMHVYFMWLRDWDGFFIRNRPTLPWQLTYSSPSNGVPSWMYCDRPVYNSGLHVVSVAMNRRSDSATS